MHQWSKVDQGYFFYTTDQLITNKNIKQNNIQYVDPDKSMICGQNEDEIYCHKIWPGYLIGIFINNLYNKVLQGCKSNFKFNVFNKERNIVSCLNNKNEYVIQIFSIDFKTEYDLNGLILCKDDINDNFTYDALQGKENELVVIRANLKKNEYFIEIFNFIKDSNNKYQICPEGCQSCTYFNNIRMKFPNNTFINDAGLKCSLCNYNRFFADNHGDKCFTYENRPKGYELIEDEKKLYSCEYCCITKKNSSICNFCIKEKKYKYFLDELNKGRCVQKCEGEYKFIKYKENLCTNTCEGETQCQSFENFMKLNGEEISEFNNIDENNTNTINYTKWCLNKC